MEMQVVTVVHWGKDGAWYKNSVGCFTSIYCWSDSSHCERKSDEAHVWIDGNVSSNIVAPRPCFAM